MSVGGRAIEALGSARALSELAIASARSARILVLAFIVGLLWVLPPAGRGGRMWTGYEEQRTPAQELAPRACAHCECVFRHCFVHVTADVPHRAFFSCGAAAMPC